MKVDTKQRKKARKGFAQVYGNEELAARMVHVLQIGKKGLDSLVMGLGRMLAETIMDMEREERWAPKESRSTRVSTSGPIRRARSIAATRRLG